MTAEHNRRLGIKREDAQKNNESKIETESDDIYDYADQEIEIEEIKRAMTTILDLLGSRKRGPKSFRTNSIWEKFNGRESDSITLEELTERFDGDAKAVQSTIFFINELLEESGFELEIARETRYKFRTKRHNRI